MRNFKLILFSLCIGLTAQLTSQNANTPPTLQTLSIERSLDAKNVLTTLAPNVPPVILAGVASGALEVRESISYNPANQVLTLNGFVVQAGTPVPAPANTANVFTIATINVDKVYSSLAPRRSLMLTGTVATNAPISPYGNLVGAAAALSIGYTEDNPPKISDVVLLVAGSTVEFSPAAQGILTFVQPPAPPNTDNLPKIVISSPTSVYTRIADLDASASTTANPPLTFQWTVVSGNADIAHADSAKALAYLNGGFGSYTFQVTATDTKGNKSTEKVTINYY